MGVKIYFQINFSSLPDLPFPASARWNVFSGCPLFLSPLRDLRVLTRSLPVDFATLHPSGCLRQSFSLRSIILPCRAPCGSLIRSFQLLTLAGLLTQSFSSTASIPRAASQAAWVA